MEKSQSADYYDSEEWRESFKRYLLAQRKRVFDYVGQHPGCTTTQIKRDVGSLAGMKEWIRDGLISKRGSGHYINQK